MDLMRNIVMKINANKNMMKMLKAALVIMVILLIAFNSIYRLDTGWSGVILRFGELQNVENRPGIHFKVPIIDEIQKASLVQIYKLEYGYKTLVEGNIKKEPKTEDNYDEAMVIADAKSDNSSVVLVNLVVRYKVENAFYYLFRVDDLEGTMRLTLENALRNTVQHFTLNEVLTNKAAIGKEIEPELQQKMIDYKTGIKIIEVDTQDTMLLPDVDAAYDTIEEANQYKSKRIQDAAAEKDAIISQAQSEYSKTLESAKGYKAEVIANAKANAAEFDALYEAYKQNPKIMMDAYYIETMKEFMKNNKITIDMTKNGVNSSFVMDNSAASQNQAVDSEKK